jgi:hypothetical protein
MLSGMHITDCGCGASVVKPLKIQTETLPASRGGGGGGAGRIAAVMAISPIAVTHA